jgi:anti-anti-sigma factor
MIMTSESPIQVEDRAGVRVISFGGQFASINGAMVAEVTGPLLAAVESPEVSKVVIDLHSVEFFNSSFIELLFRVWNRVKTREGGRFAICNVHPYCKDVLDVTNLSAVWKVFPTKESAVEAVSQRVAWSVAR